MSDLVIKTNGARRPVLNWADLSAKERKEFDYLDTEERQHDASFARYRGWTYDLSEFSRPPKDFAPWRGIANDTFFAGTLYRYVDDYESVIMGRFFS